METTVTTPKYAEYKHKWYLANKERTADKRKQYSIDNKEQIAKKTKEYRENNKAVINEQLKKYQIANKENILKQRKQFRDSHKEQIHEQYELNKTFYSRNMKQYYEDNKEYFYEKGKKYREDNKELIIEKKKQYAKDNAEGYNVRNQRRRARKLLLSHTFTTKQWEQTKNYFDNKCCYCGKEKPLAQEHFISVVNKGEFTINNIVPSCQSCNSSKGVKDFFIWYPKHRNYSKKREVKILKYLNYKNNNQQLMFDIKGVV